MRILLFILIPLVFFGAGMLFASLLWGKYKQLSLTLRRQLERQAEDSAAQREAMGSLRSEHAEQTVTCHTLEAELARIATERQTMVSDAAQARSDRTRLRRYEAECMELTEKLEATKERTQQEIQAAKDALRAAENRANLVSNEKAELLDLVGKLQSKLDQIAPLQRQLLDSEQQLHSRSKQARTDHVKSQRRAKRRADEPKKAVRRRSPRNRQLMASPLKAAKPETTRRKPINGSSRSATRRVFAAAARLLPSSSPRPKRHC